MRRIRVIVAEGPDGSAAPTGLLRAVLEQEGVEIAGEVATESELIQLAADEQPDAVVFASQAPQTERDRLRSVAPRRSPPRPGRWRRRPRRPARAGR